MPVLQSSLSQIPSRLWPDVAARSNFMRLGYEYRLGQLAIVPIGLRPFTYELPHEMRKSKRHVHSQSDIDVTRACSAYPRS